MTQNHVPSGSGGSSPSAGTKHPSTVLERPRDAPRSRAGAAARRGRERLPRPAAARGHCPAAQAGAIAREHADLEGFVKAGLYIGWTQGDFRTHELKAPIEALLAAFHAYESGGRGDEHDLALRAAWAAFDRARMEKLLGCL